jgi:hypothetical protein
MKSNYVNRATRFIKTIYPFIAGCDTVDDYCDAVGYYNLAYHRKVKVACGQTRVAIMCADYVIKLDYGHRANLWGDCESEYEHYVEAEQDGFAYLFAKITPVDFAGRTFYIMPRIAGVGSARSACYDVDEWLNDEEIEWLWDHVADVHYENYGWKNGYPVIIDYACSR